MNIQVYEDQLHPSLRSTGLLDAFLSLGYNSSIREHDFNPSVIHALEGHGIHTINDLLGHTKWQIRHIRNIGANSMANIERVLAHIGLTLREGRAPHMYMDEEQDLSCRLLQAMVGETEEVKNGSQR